MSSKMSSKTSSRIDLQFAYAAWIVALTGALGSLFFGEVMKLPPCTLCWYQRICLFPLVAVLAVGISLRDRKLAIYAAPLVLAGLGIALYHNGVQLGWIPETLTPCTGTSSCGEKQLELFGFITIPMLSASAFAVIGAFLLLHQRQIGNSTHE